MRRVTCKCGKRTMWTSMGVQNCEGCEECQTTFLGYPLEPHLFKIRYNQNTGKPYQICTRCGHIDRESYDKSKIKDNEN